MPIVLKYGSLNLLEPSGDVKACNGIALPLHEDGDVKKGSRKIRNYNRTLKHRKNC
jgi:hypothetical protein